MSTAPLNRSLASRSPKYSSNTRVKRMPLPESYRVPVTFGIAVASGDRRRPHRPRPLGEKLLHHAALDPARRSPRRPPDRGLRQAALAVLLVGRVTLSWDAALVKQTAIVSIEVGGSSTLPRVFTLRGTRCTGRRALRLRGPGQRIGPAA